MNVSESLKKIHKKPGFNQLIKTTSKFLGIKKKLRGANNTLNISNGYFYNVKIIVKGNNNQVVIEHFCKLKNCTITVHGSNHELRIGKSCFLSNTDFSFTQNKGKILVGKNTTSNGGRLYSGEAQTIDIGQDCMFSSNLDIRTTDSHSVISLDTRERINKAADIKIGSHVWLGNSSKIWKGAEIGDNTVIGAGSIVTGKVSRNSIAAGIPAKVLREDVDWDRRLL